MVHWKGAYRVLVKKPEGKRALGRTTHRWRKILNKSSRKRLGTWTGLL
jgi:hypothetical protein